MGYTTRMLKKRRASHQSAPPPTPSAIACAEAYVLDITQVPGTGSGGRVVLGDVRKYIKDNGIAPPPPIELEEVGGQSPEEE